MRTIKTTIEFVSNVIDEFENGIELQEVIISEYNEKGQIILQNHYLDENLEVLQSIIKNTYDNDGNLLESLTLNQNEEPKIKIKYLYDEQSLLQKKECYDLLSNSIIDCEIFKYDNQKRLIEINNNIAETKIVCEYDANRQLKRNYIYENNLNEFCKVLSFTYNDNNDVDSILTTNSNGYPIRLETIVYEYDENSNWIICHKNSDDNNVFIEREINYQTINVDFDKPGYTAIEVKNLKKGDMILHQTFGEGILLKIKGKSPDAIATIKFDNFGEKDLYLRYANIKANKNNNA